jgi:hypothetical protein
MHKAGPCGLLGWHAAALAEDSREKRSWLCEITHGIECFDLIHFKSCGKSGVIVHGFSPIK